MIKIKLKNNWFKNILKTFKKNKKHKVVAKNKEHLKFYSKLP